MPITVKDKAQHAVLLDKTTSEKLYKDVQSYRLVTVATLVDRLKINGSLARKCLKDLEEKGQIKPVVTHSKMKIYSMLPENTLTQWPLKCTDFVQPEPSVLQIKPSISRYHDNEIIGRPKEIDGLEGSRMGDFMDSVF